MKEIWRIKTMSAIYGRERLGQDLYAHKTSSNQTSKLSEKLTNQEENKPFSNYQRNLQIF